MRLPRWLRWRSNDELDEEIQAHLEMEIEENLARGLSPEEAGRAAKRRLGNAVLTREKVREGDPIASAEALFREVRYALRRLLASPAFTAAAVLTLALGVGATTAVFSVAEPLLARHLAVRSPGEFVLFRTLDPAQEDGRDRVPDELYSRLMADSTTLSEVLAFTVSHDRLPPLDLVIEGEGLVVGAEGIQFETVTGGYFGVLGLSPSIGRLLRESDDQEGAEAVAVISHRLWLGRFGRSPDVVGRRIAIQLPLLGGELPLEFTVVGVAPSGFYGLDVDVVTDVWVPFQANGRRGEDLSGSAGVRVMGRMREGIGLEDVQTEIDVLGPALQQETRAVDQAGRVSIVAESGARGYSDLRFEFSDPLLALGMAAGLVLVLVWTNLAALMLTRGFARGREISIRLALGSARSGIIGLFLTEGLILAAGGAASGLVVAAWGRQALTSLLPPGAGFLQDSSPGARVFVFAGAVSIIGAIGFSVLPALRVSQMAITSVMKSSVLQAVRTASFPVHRLIVGAQVLLAFVLLVGTGLYLKTLVNLRAKDIGIDPESVVEFDVNGDLLRVMDFSVAGLARIDALPGVVSTTAYSRTGLLSGGRWDVRVRGSLGEAAGVLEMPVGVRFFQTMGIPVVSGEAFPPGPETFWGQETQGVVISESLATRVFGDQDPVGQELFVSEMSDDPEGEYGSRGPVIGVVADVSHDGPRDQFSMAYYLPGVAPGILTRPRFAVRAEGDALALVPALRQAVSEFDEDFRITGVHTLEEVRDAWIAPERFVAGTSVFFGLVAALLASMGLFGVLWYSVTQRRAEIGIRMALGAQRQVVMGMLMKETLWVVGLGLALGFLAASAVTRLVASMLFGVTPLDAMSFGMAALTLIAFALLAAYLPARRASRLDPMEALRHE